MQVLSAPRQAFVPPTEVTPTATPIKWWIIPAVICSIILIIGIIFLVWWRWKKGAPKSKVEPDTIRMLEIDKRKVSIQTWKKRPHPDDHTIRTMKSKSLSRFGGYMYLGLQNPRGVDGWHRSFPGHSKRTGTCCPRFVERRFQDVTWLNISPSLCKLLATTSLRR